jgi:hypothetical protein
MRTLIAFFEIVIPDPWSSFSVALYNKVSGISTKFYLEGASGSGGAEICLKRNFTQSPLPNGFPLLLGPWRIFN